MSAPPAIPPTPTAGAPVDPAPGGDACPLCGAPLDPRQSWCLSCGAAARTRLAPAPNWRTPLIVIGIVVVLSAAGLTAALVKLTGSDTTTTVVTGATPVGATGQIGPAGAATPTASTPAPAVTTPAAPTGATPAGAATAPAAPATGATGASSVPGAARGGAVVPGATSHPGATGAGSVPVGPARVTRPSARGRALFGA